MVKSALDYLYNHVNSGNVLILVPEKFKEILFDGIELTVPFNKHKKSFKLTSKGLNIEVSSKEPTHKKQLDNLIIVGKVKFSEELLGSVKNKGRFLLIN